MLIYTYAKRWTRRRQCVKASTTPFILNVLRSFEDAQMLTPDARRAIRSRIEPSALAQRRRDNEEVDEVDGDLERIAPGEPNWRDHLTVSSGTTSAVPDDWTTMPNGVRVRESG